MTAVTTGADGSTLSSGRSTKAGERAFRWLTLGAGLLVFVLLAAIAAQTISAWLACRVATTTLPTSGRARTSR